MTRPRIGELFAGYGGLGLGTQAVIGGEIAWFSEFDTAPSKVLAHNFPGIPNHGDITKIDWSTVEPVEVLTGGFPCQDVSLAGARRGMKKGTRSGLWTEFARAIEALQPELVVIENVRGLLSAEATSPVEPDPWSVGNGTDGPALRAIGAVLGNLSELGYDAEWFGVRAADAGAPHSRYRVFILANSKSGRRRLWSATDVGQAARDEHSSCNEDSLHGSRTEGDRSVTENAHFTTRDQWGVTAPRQVEAGWPRADSRRRGGAFVADSSSQRLGEHSGEPSAQEARQIRRDVAAGSGRSRSDREWGPYRPAIERWERVTGRVAPSPTAPTGRSGGERLSAHFVEWMMGLPEGHVTDVEIPRNAQLKALGNGVVPQQAELAIRHLLHRKEAA